MLTHTLSFAGVSADSSFNAAINGTVMAIAVQPDGKVIVGGTFTEVNGVSRSHLARLHADGALDTSFPLTNSPAQYVYRIEVNGTMIHVGAGDGLRRYNVDGTLEWHFPMQVKTFAVDSQQRVVIGGQFNRVDGQFHRNLARLTASGVLDSTFAPEIGCCAGEGVYALLPRGDSILVGGAFQSVNGTVSAHVALIDAAGALDASFIATATPTVLALRPTPDGGFLRVSEGTVARHLANGTEDTGFAPLSLSTPDERFLAAAVQDDGKTIVAGNMESHGNVTRLNEDGTVDGTFGIQTDGAVHAVTIKEDGGVLLGGNFAHVNGSPRAGIVKLTSTSGSSPAPTLQLARAAEGVKLSWQAGVGSFALEAKDVNGEIWSPVNATVSSANGLNSVTVPALGAGNLFRLRSNR